MGFSLIFLFGSCICLFLGSFIFFLDTKNTLNRLFLLVCLSATFLSFMLFGKLFARNDDVAILCMKLASFWPIGVALLFHFVLVLTEKQKLLKNKLVYLLIYGPALTFSIIRLTTGLIMGEPVRQSLGWTYAMPDNAVMPALVNAWAFGLIIFAAYLCIRYDLRSIEHRKKQQARYILIGMCFPSAIAFITHMVLAPLQIDITMLSTAAFIFGIIFIGYAIWRYRLFILTPANAAQTILSTMSDALLLIGPGGKILTANQAALKLLGYKEKELIGQQIEILFPEEDIGEETSRGTWFKKLIKTGAIRESETVFKTKDGNKVYFSLSASVMHGADGIPLGVICIGRDITEFKRKEEERAKIEQQLNFVGRLAAIGEVSAGVAHELNNPLAAIQNYAQFLTKREGLDKALKGDLDTIYREAQRAGRITQNLLSFARRHKPAKNLISVNEVLAKSVDLHAYRLKVNNVELKTELDPELPRIMADFHQMQQVFTNIIVNAEQAMSETNTKGTLLVKTQKSGRVIQIIFADNGPGIAKENISRIFTPFFTTKAEGKGTGLGLSICFGIVQEHDGHIYATSNPGEGATFVVEMPIVSNDAPTVEQPDLTEAPNFEG